MPETWKEIVAHKQEQLQSRIPKAWRLPSNLIPPPGSNEQFLSIPSKAVPSILTHKEFSLTSSHDATSLAKAIRDRKLTAEEVAIAYCKRAAIAQQVCFCLTEIFFEKGIERAKWLDSELKRTGTVVGPLHGVPVSLKDTFKVKGYDTTVGVAALARNPAKENSTLVDILLDAGAVIYCKTNVPQTLMAADSHNNLFGRVLNPSSPLLSGGGSSGGEGALISMHGSPLGIGTDFGGSIRVPAMCHGIYGVKPSAYRVPIAGKEIGAVTGGEKISVVYSVGPIARSLRDCGLLLKTVSNSKPWERDPGVVYGNWEQQGEVSIPRTENWKEKLVVGVMRGDGNITPLPPITKILSETTETLRKSGHEIVEISHPSFKKCQSSMFKFFGLDGNSYMLDLIESTGEPISPWMSTRIPRNPARDVNEIISFHARREALQTELLEMWKTKDGRKVDVIVCAVAPHPVPPIDGWSATQYTSVWNLLDCPAGVIPVREMREDDLGGEVQGKVLGGWDKVNRNLWDKSKIDRKIYLGSPLSIQVVAPRLQDYRLFRGMEIIDRALHPEPTSSAKAKL